MESEVWLTACPINCNLKAAILRQPSDFNWSFFFTEFAEFLESAVLTTEPLLVIGDFNIHVDCEENTDAIRLQQRLASTGREQHVKIPTHVHGHILDLVITRQSDNIIKSPPWTDCLFSDHLPVFCNLEIEKLTLTKSCISYRKIKSIDLKALREDLSSSNLYGNHKSLTLTDLVDCYDETL